MPAVHSQLGRRIVTLMHCPVSPSYLENCCRNIVAKIVSNKIPDNIIDHLDTNVAANSDTFSSQQEADTELIEGWSISNLPILLP